METWKSSIQDIDYFLGIQQVHSASGDTINFMVKGEFSVVGFSSLMTMR